MIVEYLGVSGVGKTMLAREYFQSVSVKEAIEWPRYALYMEKGWLSRNLIKSIFVFCEAISEPLFLKKTNAIFEEIGIKGKDKKVLLFNYLSYKSMFQKCGDSQRIYLFDEGVLQLIWAAYLRTETEVTEEIVERILDLFQTPDQVYVIEADSAIIKKRLTDRGTKTRILSEEDLEGSIRKMQKIQNEIIRICIDKRIIREENIRFVDNSKEKGWIEQ